MPAKTVLRFLARALGEDIKRATPAQEINDGKDFVLTRPSVLFTHRHSTIFGAGPIVGSTLWILNGVGQVWQWLVFGAIFLGGLHDFVAFFSSIRERSCRKEEPVHAGSSSGNDGCNR